MPEDRPNAGDVVIWDPEPDGVERIYWVRIQARGSATPVFEGSDAWRRALATADELAGADRQVWLRHSDGRFEKLTLSNRFEPRG